MSLEGIQLGRYQLYQMLGSGGMGEVYLAEDSRIGRQVAIKVVRSEPYYNFDLENALRTERWFEREMKVISQLDHPHILPLYDYGETRANGTTITYMVMPYRPEGSFSAWLLQRRHKGPLPLQDVANFIGQAASALQHAHEHQVIHQDVKPSNFLIRVRPEEPDRPDLLLMDFGISRISTGTVSTSQFVEGTPAYMAPEQWQGHPTYASDQYALAVMSYELLTGHQLFSGRAETIMYKHINETPISPSNLNPVLTPAIDAVLLRALAKQPEERFPSVSAFAFALQQACADEEVTIVRTAPGSPTGPGASLLLADEQEKTEQGYVSTGPRSNISGTGHEASQEEQSATPLPVAMAPAPVCAALPQFIASSGLAQMSGSPMVASQITMGEPGATPYGAGLVAAHSAMPRHNFTANTTFRISLIIILVWVLGGLFCYFAFARTASHPVSSFRAATATSTQMSNASLSARHNHSGIRQTSSRTTLASQVSNTPTSTASGARPTVQAQQPTSQKTATPASATTTASVATKAVPLYRLYSSALGDHFYTTSAAERDRAVAAYGYQYEGIAAYVFNTQVANSVPLYRLYSSAQGDHFYTTSAAERDRAVAAYGYQYEQVACYVLTS